jgi:hypothetical protein
MYDAPKADTSSIDIQFSAPAGDQSILNQARAMAGESSSKIGSPYEGRISEQTAPTPLDGGTSAGEKKPRPPGLVAQLKQRFGNDQEAVRRWLDENGYQL